MTERSHPYVVIFTLWLMVFASASQVMIIAPILPRIAEELHVAESVLGSLMTVYAIAVGVFAMITGPVSDRLGRRRILLIGTGMLAVSLLLHGFADSFGALLLVRCVAGAAGGILSGGAVAYVGDYFPVNKRGWAGGWVMSGLAAGQIVGVPLGTLLAGWHGYRFPFYVFAGVAAIAFALIIVRLPQPDVKLSDELSLKSALKGYGNLLKRKEIRAAGIAFLMMFMGLSLFVTFFPMWLEQELSFTPEMVALLYVIGGAANVLIGPRAGKLSDRIGRVRVIIIGSIGVALFMPLITLVQSSFAWAIYPLFFMTMALIASRMSPLQALMTQLTDGGQRGMLMSLVMSIGQIGFGLGSALAAASWATFGFTGNALIAMVSVMLMAWIVWRFLRVADSVGSPGQEGEQDSKRSDSMGINVPAVPRNG